jgi:hypothetical protein
MVLSKRIPVLRKFSFINMQTMSFGGLVQDPIPALSGHSSKILPVVLRDA